MSMISDVSDLLHVKSISTCGVEIMKDDGTGFARAMMMELEVRRNNTTENSTVQLLISEEGALIMLQCVLETSQFLTNWGR